METMLNRGCKKMSYYGNLKKFNLYLDRILKNLDKDQKININSIIYEGTLLFAISKKAADERINDAVEHYGFIVDKEGNIKK